MPAPDGNLDISNPGPIAPDPGFARPSEGHQMPAPDGNLDITNPGPIVRDPGFAAPDPSGAHQMPAPDGNLDIMNPGPMAPDPGFSGGLAPMTAADASGAPPVHGLERPDGSADLRNPGPTAPDPGFAAGGLAPMTAADAGGPQGHALERPDHPVDVRDLDPAPGYSGGSTGGGGGGIQTMAGGGPAGGARSQSGLNGVDDPAALNRAGQASTELASMVQRGGLVGDDGQMMGAVGALAGDLWGGELGAELMKTMESWDRQAAKLRKSCESIGENCTQTANNYTTTESANETEMNSVRNSLADFN
ncbi:WXG100 family type VII secretion target [Streptomyces boluensis]|uniref:WXG100 family type VII secretion target n=1 Tax=Streptomyces boluensis TaxID=1775135 RepID=A0A964USG6_9ACTN|nr:WXG100 family type VII secretion target [Streptomyces boluensis]NBE53615.1 hypothetical protein [Streptomyces boluensis]